MHLCLRKCLRGSLLVCACARVCYLWLRMHAFVSVQVPEMRSACARLRASAVCRCACMRLCLRKCLRRSLHVRARARVCCCGCACMRLWLHVLSMCVYVLRTRIYAMPCMSALVHMCKFHSAVPARWYAHMSRGASEGICTTCVHAGHLAYGCRGTHVFSMLCL
jgi:hypothetical protein